MRIREESFGLGVPTFDIFRGHYLDKEATWVDAAKGLSNARDRMRQIAADKPGPYFVYSSGDRLVLDIVNTERILERGSARQNAAGTA